MLDSRVVSTEMNLEIILKERRLNALLLFSQAIRLSMAEAL